MAAMLAQPASFTFRKSSSQSLPNSRIFPSLILTNSQRKIPELKLHAKYVPSKISCVPLSPCLLLDDHDQDQDQDQQIPLLNANSLSELDSDSPEIFRSVDLRSPGVALVKDQLGHRGVLYALTTLLELLIFKFMGEKVVVSLNYLARANNSAEWGMLETYLDWAIRNGVYCVGESKPRELIKSYVRVCPSSPEDLLNILDQYGALFVVTTCGKNLQNYKTGFYYGEWGASELHAMVVVSAVSTLPDNSEGYVVLQNSQSIMWGMGGYCHVPYFEFLEATIQVDLVAVKIITSGIGPRFIGHAHDAPLAVGKVDSETASTTLEVKLEGERLGIDRGGIRHAIRYAPLAVGEVDSETASTTLEVKLKGVRLGIDRGGIGHAIRYAPLAVGEVDSETASTTLEVKLKGERLGPVDTEQNVVGSSRAFVYSLRNAILSVLVSKEQGESVGLDSGDTGPDTSGAPPAVFVVNSGTAAAPTLEMNEKDLGPVDTEQNVVGSSCAFVESLRNAILSLLVSKEQGESVGPDSGDTGPDTSGAPPAVFVVNSGTAAAPTLKSNEKDLGK